MSNAQGPQYHGTKKKTGEEDRFRMNVVAQTPLPTRGRMFTKPLPGGRSLELRRQPKRLARSPQFTIKVDGSRYRIEPGTFNSVTPTLGGTPLIQGPSETFSGTRYIYIKSEWSVTPTIYPDDKFFANVATLDDVSIIDTSDLITNPEGPTLSGEFYILLGSCSQDYVDQEFTGSVSAEVCGLVDGSGKATLEWETH